MGSSPQHVRVAEQDETKSPDECVARAAAGDGASLEQLLRLRGGAIAARLSIDARWQRAITPEDVMQVTYLEAFLRIQSLQDTTVQGFDAWLTRIAKNNLTDAIRSLQRDKRPEVGKRLTSGPSGESSRTLLARLGESKPSAATALGEREAIALMIEAVDKLPDTYASVVRALDLEERTVADYAEEVGRSTGAVHMLRARAHERLRDLLLH